MLKSDLIEKVAKELNMNHDITQLVINNIFDTISNLILFLTKLINNR